METSLHQQLKDFYSTKGSAQEVWVDGFRIDVRRGRRLIEIQTSSLGAIRDKIRTLLDRHHVTVVKPLVARKMLLVQDRADGPVRARRWSPKRCGWVDLFDSLAHFTSVFPHPRLTLEIPLIEIEENRFPRKARRFWHRAYRIEDQRLLRVIDRRSVRTSTDLLRFLDATFPDSFDTKEIAELLSTSRSMAQKIAYCLRESGAISICGKKGNAMVYRSLPTENGTLPTRIRKRSSGNKKGGPQAA